MTERKSVSQEERYLGMWKWFLQHDIDPTTQDVSMQMDLKNIPASDRPNPREIQVYMQYLQFRALQEEGSAA